VGTLATKGAQVPFRLYIHVMGRGQAQAAPTLSMRRTPREGALEAFYALPFHHLDRRNLLFDRDIDANDWLRGSGLPIADPEIFRSLVHGFHHAPSGLRVIVHSAHPSSWEKPVPDDNPAYDRDLLRLRGSIYCGDDFVGRLQLGIERDINGTLEARIGSITLRPHPEPENHYHLEARERSDPDRLLGKGFGRAFHEHLEAGLREHGVERMTLSAASEVGSYVWASLGYEYDPHDCPEHPSSAREAQQIMARRAVQRALDYPTGSISRPDYTEADLEEFRALQGQETINVFDVARVGKERPSRNDKGEVTWAGLSALRTWHGVKFL